MPEPCLAEEVEIALAMKLHKARRSLETALDDVRVAISLVDHLQTLSGSDDPVWDTLRTEQQVTA